MREAAKVAGHHNAKQKIHFVEKLQEQHRQLQKQNGALITEVAKLKMRQYRNIEATVHSNLDQSSRQRLGLSRSRKENAGEEAALLLKPAPVKSALLRRSLLPRRTRAGGRARIGSPR